jgi:hypothetical protein
MLVEHRAVVEVLALDDVVVGLALLLEHGRLRREGPGVLGQVALHGPEVRVRLFRRGLAGLLRVRAGVLAARADEQGRGGEGDEQGAAGRHAVSSSDHYQGALIR